MKRINPEFKDFVNENLSKLESLMNTFLKSISEKRLGDIYGEKIEEILKELKAIKQKFELYNSKFKYFTEETGQSLRKFGFLIGEFTKDLSFNKDAFDKENNEIYLLNVVNNWSSFHGNIKALFYNIENAKYPYSIHTCLSIALVLIPFVNIMSLFGGIYLITKKDWRALIWGAIILILYLIPWINVIYLTISG